MVQGINFVGLEPFCIERAGVYCAGWYLKPSRLACKWCYLQVLNLQN